MPFESAWPVTGQRLFRLWLDAITLRFHSRVPVNVSERFARSPAFRRLVKRVGKPFKSGRLFRFEISCFHMPVGYVLGR